MSWFKSICLATVLLPALGGHARAQSANVSYSYTTDMTSYSGSGNGTYTVDVFLTETLTNGATSLITSQNGLYGAGVGIEETSGNATITAFNFNTGTLTTSAPGIGFGTGGGFDNVGNIQPNGGLYNAALVEVIGSGNTNGVYATSTSSGGGVTINNVFLGSFTIQAGSVASQFNVESLANNPNTVWGGTSQNTVTFAGSYDLDFDDNYDQSQLPNGTYKGANDVINTFSVAPSGVPEPGSMILCGLAFGGMGFSAWRRRKKDVTVEAAAAAVA